MQRRKSSRIVSSDFPTLGGRNQGTYILQSHGTNVSRGDLIKQDNIIPDPNEPIEPYTITISKDNFSTLCTIGNPVPVIGYQPDPYVTESSIQGTVAQDANGIYASNFGSGSSWHGPQFYMQLPYAIGKSGQYWHIVLKVTYNMGGYIILQIRAGFSTHLKIDNSWGGSTIRKIFRVYNQSTSNDLYNTTLSYSSTITDTIRFYHYPGNTLKVYVNSSVISNKQDPIPLNKGDNFLICTIGQFAGYGASYHRIQEITVSTDPQYDPQP